MADKKQNLKSLFSNPRSRVIILFTLVILVITVTVGYFRFIRVTGPLGENPSDVNRAPYNIKSIPGALNQTAQYAQLQQQQNIEQAQAAMKTGTSAIPTIIRSQAFGEGVQVVGAQGGKGSVGFGTLANENLAGAQSDLWLQDVRKQNCSRASVSKVMAQGAQLSDIKSACGCRKLKSFGYHLSDLKPICACDELRTAGFGIEQLKQVGFSAEKLRQCGFSACDERAAGFSAADLKNAGYSDGELKGAGFSDQDVAHAGGLPDGVTANDVARSGCGQEAIARLRASGVSAGAIRRISGCGAAQLKAAGFDAEELRKAGFSPADLKLAGFSPEQLKRAGYKARDLLNAGFQSSQLADAGFTPTELARAEAQLPSEFTPGDVKKAGCGEEALKRERAAGVSAASIKQYAGCGASALRAAGFTPDELARANFSPKEIEAASLLQAKGLQGLRTNTGALRALLKEGIPAKELRGLKDVTAAKLKKAGADAHDLLAAGFTPAQLAALGFTPNQLKAATIPDAIIKAAGCDEAHLKILLSQGVSAKRIHALNGCSLSTLKAAGATLGDLSQAGFTPEELLAAGFTPKELSAAKLFSDDDIKGVGCDPAKLKTLIAQGVSVKRIEDLNHCGVSALKLAGATANALDAAGFTPDQIGAAGFSPKALARAGILAGKGLQAAGCDPAKLKLLAQSGASAKRIHELSRCTADELKKAGFDLKSLADAGFSPSDLLSAGYTPDQLKSAGMALTPAGVITAARVSDCSVASLRAAHAMHISASTIKQTIGCRAEALKAAGFSPLDLKHAGFTAAELKNAGFGADALKGAGFSASDLRAAGFSAAQLARLGFSPTSLAEAGFSPEQLKAAGLSAAQLKAAGLTASQLKAAGFTAEQLHDAAFSANALKHAGFGPDELKKVGFSNRELESAGFSPQDTALAGLDALDKPNVAIPPASGLTGQDIGTMHVKNTQQLQDIAMQQQKKMMEQRNQQKIQQRAAGMLTAANQDLADWKNVASQRYEASKLKDAEADMPSSGLMGPNPSLASMAPLSTTASEEGGLYIKTGDVIFAVIDTSVNSDEPGPILATIVSGALKGSKLIGSFILPSNADKMVISFNTLSVPGISKTLSIGAYAIDANTARTALSSETNHHYLSRYGSLFASTFLEGFGNAFQSADTTITVGGTGGTTDTTVQNGIGRSALENAVIGLATLGKAWGQVAQQNMSRPTTVQVFSGTGIGVLFTQDLKITQNG